MQNELSCCRLCPRMCGADRLHGGRGFCGAGAKPRIARAALHFWEEPIISGKRGSGTVFFSGCTMKCVFCQNYEVSTNNLGYEVTEGELADIFCGLMKSGANNINLVTPTHFVPQIKAATAIARKNGMTLPIVYNTGGYERVETIKSLEGYVNIYMPDFKYFGDTLAAAYSKAPHYRETAAAAIAEMYRQTGAPVTGDDGVMRRGVIIRHLMLPGCLADTVKVINYVNHTYHNNVYFSLMSQYTPLRRIPEHPRLNGKLSSRAYAAAVSLCGRLGMENVFIQEGTAASESFIPEFAGEADKKS